MEHVDDLLEFLQGHAAEAPALLIGAAVPIEAERAAQVADVRGLDLQHVRVAVHNGLLTEVSPFHLDDVHELLPRDVVHEGMQVTPQDLEVGYQ